MTGTPATETLLHASSIAFGPHRGILILGPSGSGKSALSLILMALSASLISDDQTLVQTRNGTPYAFAPAAIRGLIEARGIGILRMPSLDSARLVLAIDMGTEETARLPPQRQYAVNGSVLPLLHKVVASHFPAAILHYVHSITVSD